MPFSTLIKTTLATLAFVAPALSTVPTYAAPNTATSVTAQLNVQSGDFVKKKYKIQGDWKIVQENGQTLIRFSDSFKTKNGPDLKVFLSPQSIDAVNGKTATQNAVLLGRLTSNKGTQDYVIPAGVTLSNFSSLLVHCEAYSVLWGGGALS